MAMAAVAPARFPVGNKRILWGFGESSSSVYDVNGGDVRLSVELEGAMLSDTVFRFLDESPDSTVSSSSGTVDDGYGPYGVRVEEGNEEEDKEEEEEEGARIEDNRVFWESHHKLLKDTLSKTSPTETSIRIATKETIKEIQSSATRDGYINICKCKSTPEQVMMGIGSCKNCLMSEICQRLRARGYDDTAVWRTKWRSNHDIPSGEHKFIIVRNKGRGGGGDGEQEEVIIEVRFKAEFEMGITTVAPGEYSQLMERVPAVFVGRADRMKMVVKILCSAAKKWCKEKKVHLGPWRKHKFMHAKWFNASCRKVVESGGDDVVLVSRSSSRRSTNNKASMLTAALNFAGSDSNNNSLMRPNAVAVL